MSEPAPIKTGEIHWEKWDTTIRYEVFSYHMDFKLREGVKQDDGSVVYTAAAPNFVTDFDQAERFVDGSIKWDGCSHLNFGDGEDNPGYMHVCGARYFRNLASALRETFLIASREMDSFAPDVAELDILSHV